MYRHAVFPYESRIPTRTMQNWHHTARVTNMRRLLAINSRISASSGRLELHYGCLCFAWRPVRCVSASATSSVWVCGAPPVGRAPTVVPHDHSPHRFEPRIRPSETCAFDESSGFTWALVRCKGTAFACMAFC